MNPPVKSNPSPVNSSELVKNYFAALPASASLTGLTGNGSARSGVFVINSSDCLFDYYELLKMGIQPFTKPQYTTQGLSFAIQDPFGNSYTILEERDYQEI